MIDIERLLQEVTRIENAKSDLKEAINSKLDVEDQLIDEKLDEYAAAVEKIEQGSGGGSGGGEGAKLTDLVVNLNGEYLPNAPYNGFRKVTVSVPTEPSELPVPTITSFPRATELIGTGKTLSESTLLGGTARYGNLRIDGTFTWVAPSTIVNSTSYHNVLFTPNADDAYASTIISVQVPVIEVPNNQVLKITRQIGISDPTWTKVGYNATLVANANKLSSTPSEFTPAQDDYYDNPDVPVFGKIKLCNVNDETGEIIAWHGDPDFKWDGSENTSVYTYFPTFWFRRRRNGDMEEVEVAEVELEGGVKLDAFLVATFAMDNQTITLSDESGTKTVLRSYAGATPDYHYVDSGVNTVRTQAKATAGDNASAGDWRVFVIGWLHVIKYGTNNIQNAVGTGRSNSSSGNTAVGNAHLILDGRDGYIGSQTSTSIWSLKICDFWANKGWLLDGIYSTGVDNKVRFCADPSKFVQNPASDQDGYYELGYEISTSNGYITEVGIDDTNDNPVAQVIPLRVKEDIAASSSTGTTDYYYYNSSYRYGVYGAVGSTSTYSGVFAFGFIGYGGSSYGSGAARVLRPITL